jgi:transcription initiation factor TFIIIB Brf1 subunit/transcription initiation factor TFIIB
MRCFNCNRDEVHKKYQEKTMACKICGSMLKLDALKEHTSLCRHRAELTKELKEIDSKLNDKLFDSIMKTREANTNLILETRQLLKYRENRDPKINQLKSPLSVGTKPKPML